MSGPDTPGERRPPTVAIVGVTASGKSALALAVARRLPDVELVTVDSMQVYRGMDVGTAKPTAAERAEVPHHLIDVADPWEEYSLARYRGDAAAVLADLATRGRRAVLVGGTALYLRALVDDLDVPGRFPDVRAELDADPDTRALHARLATLGELGRLPRRRLEDRVTAATAPAPSPASRPPPRRCGRSRSGQATAASPATRARAPRIAARFDLPMRPL